MAFGRGNPAPGVLVTSGLGAVAGTLVGDVPTTSRGAIGGARQAMAEDLLADYATESQ